MPRPSHDGEPPDEVPARSSRSRSPPVRTPLGDGPFESLLRQLASCYEERVLEREQLKRQVTRLCHQLSQQSGGGTHSESLRLPSPEGMYTQTSEKSMDSGLRLPEGMYVRDSQDSAKSMDSALKLPTPNGMYKRGSQDSAKSMDSAKSIWRVALEDKVSEISVIVQDTETKAEQTKDSVTFADETFGRQESPVPPLSVQERWVALVNGVLGKGTGGPCGREPSIARTFKLQRHWSRNFQECKPSEDIQGGQLIMQNVTETSVLIRRASTVAANASGSFKWKCVVSGSSWFKFVWCTLGTLSLAWDTIMIPVQLLLLNQEEEIMQGLAWVIFFFWLTDMPIQCISSFQYADGRVELRVKQITKNYIKTWFPLDATVLLVDGTLLLFDSLDTEPPVGENTDMLQAGSRSFRLARLMRLLRLVRLMRFRKLNEFLVTVGCRIRSEHVLLGLKLMKHIVLIVLINHYIACTWCALALFLETERSWMRTFVQTETFNSEVYIMALHWSMTQFSPATNNISPQNPYERIFAVCVVLFAFISFSSFISSVTNTVNELNRLKMDEQREELRIREFLFARRASPDLVRRILKFFKQNYNGRKKKVHEEDISFFKDVPETMKIQLHQEAYFPFLAHNCIFNQLAEFGTHITTMVCHRAFREKFFLPQQDVFVDGIPSQGVYFVRSGRLDYHCDNHIALGHMAVNERDWVSELSILLEWNHAGHLCAETSTDLLMLDKNSFNQIVTCAQGPFVECLRLFAVLTLCHIEQVAPKIPITDLSLGDDLLRTLGEKARKLYELKQVKPMLRDTLS